jgi:hypothetical protein
LQNFGLGKCMKTNQNGFNQFVLGLFTILAFQVGCSASNNIPNTTRPQNTPTSDLDLRLLMLSENRALPPCKPMLEANIFWPDMTGVFSYTLTLGFLQQAPFWTQIVEEGATNIDLELPGRGVFYHVNMNVQFLNGSSGFKSAKFYIPTCEEREKWKKKHPNYNEPFQLYLDISDLPN